MERMEAMNKITLITLITMLLITSCVQANEITVHGTNTKYRDLIGQYDTINEAQVVFDTLGQPKTCAIFTDRFYDSSDVKYSLRCVDKPFVRKHNGLAGSVLVQDWR